MPRSTCFVRRIPQATAVALALSIGLGPITAYATHYPITPEQRQTAKTVAEAGVPVSELAENAPDSYTIKKGDTLWDISKIFLKSPWRWPELWGMNLEQIRNPHLIYPGQVLVLIKTNGRAHLRVGESVGGSSGSAGGTNKLSPRVRSSDLDRFGIPSIPLNLIEPFLNEAVIFEENQLAAAPRIVAAQDGRVMLSRGEIAYVRGDLGGKRDFRVFREPRALLDPTTKEVLGFEAIYLGTAELIRRGNGASDAAANREIIPDTVMITSIRQEVRADDRLSPVPPREFINYVPHPPNGPIAGQLVSIYGEGVTAGQNQIVSLNRGSRDGLEAGHILALWSDGARIIDKTDPKMPTIKLPDEHQGLIFVFRVFNRMSYALILQANAPVHAADRFTQP